MLSSFAARSAYVLAASTQFRLPARRNQRTPPGRQREHSATSEKRGRSWKGRARWIPSRTAGICCGSFRGGRCLRRS